MATLPVDAVHRQRAEGRWWNQRRSAVALIAIAVFWLVVWYRETAASIVAIWMRSETFAHGVVVILIVVYLVWRSRHRLSQLPLRPFPPALVFAAVIGFGWLLAELGSVLGGEHFMFAAMISILVWVVAGTAITRELAFPLAFLFFAVPFGEFMLPALMRLTADFTVSGLRLSAIPVYREGLHFVIHSGRWSIVEACSGINYLIASFMVGTLFAYLTFRSLYRRLAFVVVSILVPLVVNGIRAYLIVLIAHVSDNRLATGIDHILFGWVLFGAIMLLIFWVASHYREDQVPADVEGTATPNSDGAPISSLAVAAFAAVAVMSVWKPAAAILESRSPTSRVHLDAAHGAGGWVERAAGNLKWEPDFAFGTAKLNQTFAKGSETAGLSVVFYRDQQQGRELIMSQNHVVSTSNERWAVAQLGSVEPNVANLPEAVVATEFFDNTQRLVAWHWYWIGGRRTSSEILAKVYVAINKLLGRGDDSALVVIYTPKNGSQGAESAVLRDFAAAIEGSVDAELDRAWTLNRFC